MICSRSPSWEGIPPGSNSHVLPSAARLSLVQPQILVQAPNPPGSPRKLQSLGDTGRAPACLLHPVGPARGSESSRGPMDSLVFTQDGVVPGGQCFLTPNTHTHAGTGSLPFSALPLGPNPFITVSGKGQLLPPPPPRRLALATGILDLTAVSSTPVFPPSSCLLEIMRFADVEAIQT